jgi:hypothetical protein
LSLLSADLCSPGSLDASVVRYLLGYDLVVNPPVRVSVYPSDPSMAPLILSNINLLYNGIYTEMKGYKLTIVHPVILAADHHGQIMDGPKERSSKRKSSYQDEEHKRKKKHHKSDGESKSSSRKKDHHKAVKVVDDDVDDESMWVEHNIDVDGQHVSLALYANAWNNIDCFS